jgi:hypothetical protein
MAYQFHRWVIIQHDDEVYSGEDDFPNELMKLNCRTFIFDTPESPEIEFPIPKGHKLIFKRRVRIEKGVETGEEIESWRYVISSEAVSQDATS